MSISGVGVKKKLRRLSTVGYHDLKKVAGINSSGLFSLLSPLVKAPFSGN